MRLRLSLGLYEIGLQPIKPSLADRGKSGLSDMNDMTDLWHKTQRVLWVYTHIFHPAFGGVKAPIFRAEST